MTTPPSVEAMYRDNGAPTSPLDEFLVEYEQDDNAWWRIACGHHMNLFDDAIDRIEQARALHASTDFATPDGIAQICATCRVQMPCPTLLALRGES